ncbi:unnamed protein product [Discosporangium mesarthrocarpum]
MRYDTKMKVERRKQTIALLRWLYSRRRDANLNGTALSREHRKGRLLATTSLTYGEVDIPDFLAILDITKPQQDEIFVDLGSGTGKAVLTASLGFPEFSKCVGIELVGSLATAATDYLRAAQQVLDAQPNPVSASSPMPLLGGGRVSTKGRSGFYGGKSKGKGKVRSAMAAEEGLRAEELEKLITDLLKASNQAPPAEEDRTGAISVQDVASRLVASLGHRKYKASLRGFGGLKKFLEIRCRDESTNLTLSNTCSHVSLATDQPPAGSTSQINKGNTWRQEGPLFRDRGSIIGGLGQEPTPGHSLHVPQGLHNEKTGFGKGYGRDENSSHTEKDCRAAGNTVIATSLAKGAGSEEQAMKTFAKAGQANFSVAEAGCGEGAMEMRLPASTRAGPGDSEKGEKSDHENLMEGLEDSGGSEWAAEVGEDGTPTEKAPPVNALSGPLSSESLKRVKLVCGDIFKEDWSDAGVVYVASLLFDNEMMAGVAAAAGRLAHGARVVSLKPIPNSPSCQTQVPPTAGTGGKIASL